METINTAKEDFHFSQIQSTLLASDLLIQQQKMQSVLSNIVFVILLCVVFEYQLQCRPTQDTATLGKIVKINKKYEEKMDLQHVMVDGDMIMMEEEVILMRQKPKKEKKPKKKEKNSVGGKNSSKKSRAKREIKQANIWPDKTKIPYDFDTSSIAAYIEDLPVGQTVLDALASIEKVTCLRFVTRNKEEHFIRFTNGKVCASVIGFNPLYAKNVGQPIILGPQCSDIDIIQHEILHALGFYHEHQRTDRDQYVNVHWQNVEDGQQKQFAIRYGGTALGFAYDKKSLMHYGRYEWSKNSQITLEDKQNPSAPLGGTTLTATDINQINTLYGCTANN